MKYAFYPGCSLDSTARDFRKSTEAVCERLGIELKEIPGWTCCGSSPGHASSATLAVSLPVVNLLKAEAMGCDVVTTCAACYSRLRAANEEMSHDSAVRRSVDDATRAQYRGTVRVRHLLDVLVNDLGLDLIRDYVERPLRGLRVACYYGCLLTRPPKVVAFDDPEHPTTLDRLMTAIGAKPVEWPAKVECCGAGLSLTSPDVMRRLAFGILEMAQRAGADCVAVACPLCQSNLDLRQKESTRAAGSDLSLPVLYFTQLLGLAFGLKPKALGLGKLVVSPRAVLEQIGALRG
jgi:heterodisulfide reductase subunit B